MKQGELCAPFFNYYYFIIIFAMDLVHIYLDGSSVAENVAVAKSTQGLK